MFNKQSNNKLLIFYTSVVTIILTRIILLIFWNNLFMIVQKQDNWHHIYTGLIILVISKFSKSKISSILYGIGIGLFLDEFIHVFHLMGIIESVDYWSLQSIIATLSGLFIFKLILFRVHLKSK